MHATTAPRIRLRFCRYTNLLDVSTEKIHWRERTGVYNWFTVNKFTDDQCDPPNNIDMTQLTHDQ